MEPPDLRELRRYGLRYTSDDAPGIRRRRAGRGFAYLHPDGLEVGQVDRRRIDQLAVPPAWTDVWICTDPSGHLQATGRDARARKQHRYHPRWRALRDERKFGDLAAFGDALSDLRGAIDSDLARPGVDDTKLVALVLALMDETLVRVGNDEYARSNGTYGLTTLTNKHVSIDGSHVRFRFVGKGGIRHEVDVDDRRLARLVRRCHELGGRELFSYTDAEGNEHRVDSSAANEYLRRHVGEAHSVKTFRTWGASALAVEHLALHPEAGLIPAIDVVARRLGNTRAIARSSYVHPEVGEWSSSGRLEYEWARSRDGARLGRGESTLRKLLGASGG